jgi:hypothetical protein
MNNKKIDFYQIAYRIVPVLRNAQYQVQDSYKHREYTEAGMPQGIEPEMDVTEAQALLAQFTLKR